MTSRERNSSDLVLILGGVALLCVGAAWLLLKKPWSDGEAEPFAAAPDPAVQAPATPLAEPAPPPGAGDDDRDNLFERAELAQQAGFLFEPEGSSAWELYLLIRERHGEDARVGAALRELAAVLLRRAGTAMDQGRLENAQELLAQITDAGVSHEDLAGVRERFERQVGDLFELADSHARAERWNEAGQALVRAAALGAPAGDVRLAENRLAESRVAAEQRASEEAQQEQVAADATAQEATGADPLDTLLQAFDAALAENRLLAPQQDNARQHLEGAQRLRATDQRVLTARTQLTDRLLDETREAMARAELQEAEGWLEAAEALGANSSTTVATREDLERRLIAAESARVLPITALTLRNYVPPVYPVAATRGEIEGWVDVEFTVTTGGQTDDIEIVGASHDRMFRNESLRAVSQWEFEPRVYRGTPIAQRTGTRLRFRMPD